MILLYVILVIIPILIISFFSFVTYTNDTNAIGNILLDYAIRQTSDNISEKMAGYRNIITQIATNTETINLFKQFDSSPSLSYEAASARNQLTNQFSFYMQMDNYITSMAFITNSSDTAVFDRYDFSSYYVSRWGNRNFLNSFKAYGDESNMNTIHVITAVNFPDAPEKAAQHLYFTFPAMDTITRQNYGTLVMEVDNAVFNSIINIKNNSTMLDTYISPSSCLTDAYGRIITSPNHSIIGTDLSKPVKTSLSQALYKSLQVKGTSLNLNLIFEKNSMQKYIDDFRNLVIILTIVITICFIIIVYIVTGRLWTKVRKIAFAIKQFGQNQRDVVIDIDESDEILYIIVDQFNKMASEITTLVEELKEKNEHVAMVMNQRRKAEIKALQAQINPHFIYNALDRINWIAIDNDQHEISSMLNGLASLLRYSISNIDILVPLKAEIQWMEKYVFIQCKRFDKKINLVCSAYGDAIDFPIYKMLLQPLVENSILHGFERVSEDSRIELTAQILPDARLKIILSDNGSGMDTETLAEIQKVIDNKGGSETDSIGINNVAKRLWLYYGEEAEISVESIQNAGATFTIVIPYREQS